MTARTIAPASGSSGISRRNERSILSVCTGSARSRESDDQPAPKSSIAICSPSARSSRSSGPIRSGSRSVADSVSSIVSRDGSTPRRAHALAQLGGEVGPVQLARRHVEGHARLEALVAPLGDLRGQRVDDPRADRLEQAHLLGGRDEGVRAARARARGRSSAAAPPSSAAARSPSTRSAGSAGRARRGRSRAAGGARATAARAGRA